MTQPSNMFGRRTDASHGHPAPSFGEEEPGRSPSEILEELGQARIAPMNIHHRRP